MNRPFPWTAFLLAFVLGGCILPQEPPPRDTLQISGRVVDAETGKPVSDARVWVSGYLKSKTSSDQDGRFLTNPDSGLAMAAVRKPVPPNEPHAKNLIVECGGYASKEIDVSNLLFEGDPATQPARELKAPVQLRPKKSSP